MKNPIHLGLSVVLTLSTLLRVPAGAQSITWDSIPAPNPGVVSIEHSGTELFVLTSASLHHTSNDGGVWERSQPTGVSGFEGGYDILLLSPETLLLSQYFKLWRSIDNGSTWQELDGIRNEQGHHLWHGGPGEFFVSGIGLSGGGRWLLERYSDGGANRENIYSINTNIFDFCTSPSGEYLVADNGFQDKYNPSLSRLPKVMHRLPSAADWVAFPIPQGPQGPVMYALAAVADSRSGRGPLIFAGGMATYRSSDNGASWARIIAGLSDRIVRKLAVAPDGTVFAALERGGLAYTVNDGDSWVDASSGLPTGRTLADIAFDSPGHIYVADSLAVYKSAQIFTGVEGPGSSKVPNTYRLDQNYPNPFNPSTTIRYGLPSRSHVTLTVFNTLGQQVATLVEGEQEAGFHEATFDASGLASGVYLYRLTAGSFVETRKLVLVR